MKVVPQLRDRPLRPFLLALFVTAAPAGCMSHCYYDGPQRGSTVPVVAGDTATGDASYTKTPFSFAIRYHGLEVDGVPLTGFVAAFGDPDPEVDGFDWAATGEWPTEGTVVSLGGWIAQAHPDWLCRRIRLGTRVAPGTGGAAGFVCPSFEDDADGQPVCAAPEFLVVAKTVFDYEIVFNQEIEDPALFVSSDACEVDDAQ